MSTTDFNSLRARIRERMPHVPQCHILEIVMEDETLMV